MTSTPLPTSQRLIDSLSLKALIAAIICLVMIPAGPLVLAIGVASLVREQHRVIAGVATLMGALETVVLISVFVMPNGCLPRSHGNEAAAETTLRSGLLPSMIQFQNMTLRDEDKDGVGEFGFPNEMAGNSDGRASDDEPVLLPSFFAIARPRLHGYRYVVYFPDGAGVASERTAITDHSQAAIDARERHWIAYAWPEQWGESGRRMYCIDERGELWCTKPAKEGSEPRWDSALSAGWGSAPTTGWERWKR